MTARGVLTSTYDPLHRLATLLEDGRTFTYAYDLHGNVVRKTLPNGETVAQSFDTLNRVISIEGRQPGSPGALLYRSGYRYDLAGNVVLIREDYQTSPAPAWREITQSYDSAQRLVSEQYRHSAGGILGTPGSDRNVVYTYDDADNRIAKEIHYLAPDREDYTYTPLNQLVHCSVTRPARPAQTASSRDISYTYDLHGNRLTCDDGTTPAAYSYDYDQRLVTAEDPAHAYSYVYDYRTRRLQITTAPGGGGGGSTVTTGLSFSGGTSVQEYTDGALSVEFIRGSDFGGGIGGLLYSLRGGVPSYTHYNHRGDVVAKTDTAHTVTYQAAYEAYGTRTEETGSSPDRQRANTKDEDPTGLLNEGFRYRDLQTGTFITRDPAGFVDGPNLYTYVRQNPWTKFDPEGLEEFPASVMKVVNQVAPHLTIPLSNTTGRMAALNMVGEENRYEKQENPLMRFMHSLYDKSAASGLSAEIANKKPWFNQDWRRGNIFKKGLSNLDPLMHDVGPANIKPWTAAELMGVNNSVDMARVMKSIAAPQGTAEVVSHLVINAQKNLMPFISAKSAREQAQIITDYLREGQQHFWEDNARYRHMTPAQMEQWRKSPDGFRMPDGSKPSALAPNKKTKDINDQMRQVEQAEKNLEHNMPRGKNH